VSEGVFPGGALGDFSKIFPGGAKSGEINFSPFKTTKTTFFVRNFKIQGDKAPCLPFRRPCVQIISSTTIRIILRSLTKFKKGETFLLYKISILSV